MHAHLFARFAALVLFASLAACEATTAPWNSAPSNTPHLIAGVRANFAKHWSELLVDPSPAAARTRASVIAWALREDPELLAMLLAREPMTDIVMRGRKDAERATEAFPQEADAWLSLAQIRASGGDMEGAGHAACRAFRLDKMSVDARFLCNEMPPAVVASSGEPAAPWTAADRARAKTIADGDLHVALRNAEARTKRVCGRSASYLSWAELVVCGDEAALDGRRAVARARYRAAVLTTTKDEAQYLALQRIEELDGNCRDVLELLPAARAAGYAKWKTSLAAQIRPPLRAP